MATRVFSEEELDRLRRFPEISWDELIRFITLTDADELFARSHRGPANVLGVAVQLCTLPWLGFVPDEVSTAPAAAATRLAERLDIPVTELAGYGQREQTRTDHLREVARYLGWHPPGELQWKELEEFLLARALEHDSPTLLFRQACDYLIAAKVIRPGVVSLVEKVAAARAAATRETYQRLAHLLGPRRRDELDALLVVDPAIGSTWLHWLGVGPTQASPAAVKAELAKLTYLRGLDAHTLDLSMLPTERRRFLAGLGRRLTAQALTRREPERRYPILLALLAQSATDMLDEVIGLFDQAVSGREGQAWHRMDRQLAERARRGEGRQALLDEILAIACDPAIPDERVGTLLREGVGLARLRQARAEALPRLPRDHGHLGMLAASYSYLREFTPEVLRAIDFAGGVAARPLLEAVTILRTLNATGARKVPEDAPDQFVPTRWRGYLERAAATGDTVAYRHFWELTVLLALRDGLRSGDVFVPGSRRYADPAAYLLPPQAWPAQRAEFCRLVGKPADADTALAAAEQELRIALAELDQVLAQGGGPVRLDDHGDLVIAPLTAEQVPDAVDELRDELAGLLPVVPLASVLIELDARTGFLDCFTHAGGARARSPELKRNLLAVLISQATNLGLVRMAEASGIPYDVLAWTAEWYVREDTLRAANTAIVNHHHRLPFTAVFGGGTLSSSDGQRFPTKGKSLTARVLSRYFAQEGLSTYTHVSDQHSTYGAKVIVATEREAHYVLDEILGNTTDLPIVEHTTDTHGVTLVNFGLFDLVGKQFSPRIRDLGKITLYRTGPRAEFTATYPAAGPLLTQRLDVGLVAGQWDELLRLAASVAFGHTTASLIVGKLSASDRQNTLAAALKEYGALRRTIYAARYLTDESYRRRIARQLNKGESLHALRRTLFYAYEGAVRHRHPIGQTEQAWCLTLVANAVVTWTTEYYGRAVDTLGAAGRVIDPALLGHISPAHTENVNFFGSITVDIDRELAKLAADGYRPLRAAALDRTSG
jgi:TnpA family transposase